jgi:hypothetical protein
MNQDPDVINVKVPAGTKVSRRPDGTIDIVYPTKAAPVAPTSAPVQAPVNPVDPNVLINAVANVAVAMINASSATANAAVNSTTTIQAPAGNTQALDLTAVFQQLSALGQAPAKAATEQPTPDAPAPGAPPPIQPPVVGPTAPPPTPVVEPAPVVDPTAPPAPPAAPAPEPTPTTTAPEVIQPVMSDKDKMRLIQKRAVKARFKLSPDQLEELAKLEDFSETAVDAKIAEFKTSAATSKGATAPAPAINAEKGDEGPAFADFLK